MLHVIEPTNTDGASDGARLPREHARAIVTLCADDAQHDVWASMCRANWLTYGGQHGYDVIEVTAPLDRSEAARSRAPSWQKCLMLEQPWARHYERVIWLDPSIVISAHARDVIETLPDPTLIGLCPSGDQLSRGELQTYLERYHGFGLASEQLDLLWSMHVGNHFERAGLPPNEATLFDTDVLVLAPVHHGAWLRAIYEQATPSAAAHEPEALSHAISRTRMHARLSARFNWNLREAMLLRFGTWVVPPFSRQQTAELVSFVMDEMRKADFINFTDCMPVLMQLAELRRRVAVPA